MPARKTSPPPGEEKPQKPDTKTETTAKAKTTPKKPAARKTTAKKPTAKRAPAVKEPETGTGTGKPVARKKAPAKTETDNQAPVKKKTPAKKPPAEKKLTTEKKPPAEKKPPQKKTTVKEPAAKNENNPPTDEKKPRPRSPRNGVELPEGRKFKAGEEARQAGHKGGVKSAQVRAARKTLKQELLDLLQVTTKDSDGKDRTRQEKISLALILKAQKGDVRAYESIRDTIGEKQKDQVEVAVTAPKFEALDAAFASLKGDAL